MLTTKKWLDSDEINKKSFELEKQKNWKSSVCPSVSKKKEKSIEAICEREDLKLQLFSINNLFVSVKLKISSLQVSIHRRGISTGIVWMVLKSYKESFTSAWIISADFS